jgi:hypothetical protein
MLNVLTGTVAVRHLTLPVFLSLQRQKLADAAV